MTLLDAKVSKPKEGGPSFSFKHRLLRAIWGVYWRLLGSWTPAPLHPWRRFLLRSFGARIACTAKVYPGVRVWYPPNLEMQDYSCLGREVNCYCMDRIVIGSRAVVSQGAHLCGGTHDPDNLDFQLIPRPITVGPEAWIAAESFVGPGVTVGEGAILGARAAAFKDLEPWTIYGGNPAKMLRLRSRKAN